jgi:formate-dependent nitrite reductase membrane component NrfD
MAGDSFRLGYRFQRHWDVSMASAFFCGEVGAGLFFVAMLCGSSAGMVLGLAITGIGKPAFHLTHMGIPRRSWRAILRPDRSWISRGLIGIVAFCGFGVLYAADAIAGGVLPAAARTSLGALAAAAALVVMTYQGFAMAQSSAIALWSTASMPLASLLYALLSGAMLVLAVQPAVGGHGVALARVAMGLLAATAMMLFSLLYTAHRASPAARLSAELLTRTRYAAWFHGLVVGAGIVLPLVALALYSDPMSRLIAALGALSGFYAFRILIFKAGVYQPVVNLASR